MLYMYSLNIRPAFMTDNLIIASFSNPIISNTLIDATLYLKKYIQSIDA